MSSDNKGKAVIYARVSKDDGSQTTANQVPILYDFAQRLGLTVTKEYIDHITGGTSEREQFQQMFTDLEHKPGMTVLFFSLDRFSREGAREVFNYLNRLESYKIVYKSYSESWLDNSNPINDITLAIFATLAKMERQKIGERTVAGLERVKREGSRSGRPIGRPAMHIDIEHARLLLHDHSERETARILGVAPGTLRTKLHGRHKKKGAPIWSNPVAGYLTEEGRFEEGEAGDVLIRYDRATGEAYCMNHHGVLGDCMRRHTATTATTARTGTEGRG